MTLAGALIRLRSSGRYPVVVFMRGSGPSIRTSWLSIGYPLAAPGIGALIYDKRGSGSSTGDVDLATVDEIAG